MATHNIIDKAFQKSLPPPHRSEGQRFEASRGALPRVLAARKPNLKRPPSIPEPVKAWRGNERNPFRAQRCIQIDAPHSLEKLLIKKPFLDPYEGSIVVLHGDHHGGLLHEPFPRFERYSSQPNA